MLHLIFILISLALLIGFFALTRYEARRGVRVYAEKRQRLDTAINRAEFIITHVNLALFVREELRHLISRIGHDVAHISLHMVRAAERLLTRAVRHLRASPEIESAPRETAREFVKTLYDFKGNLEATRPEISDI
jgi:hypothetical protein